MLFRIILAIDAAALRHRFEGIAGHLGAEVEDLRGRQHLVDRIGRLGGDLLVVSRSLLAEPATTLAALRKLPDAPALIVLDGEDGPEEVASWIAAGCDAVLPETISTGRLQEVISSLLEKRRAVTAALRKAPRQPALGDFVSRSATMQAFMDLVRRVAASDVSLLILGETGVGKEHLARAMHGEGARAAGPFVAVSCAALPETLLESELFGHEEGAFTGASRARRGCFELAHRGTLFLDEIGEMPPHLQVKLLRALQDRQIQRIGSERLVTVDVRVMAATNRDILADIAAGRFRQDLYFRLGVVTLTVPPLRERREDIPMLVENYIGFLRSRVGRPVTGIAPQAVDALLRYAWPGNVRELINVLERAMLLCAGTEIALADLPYAIRTPLLPPAPAPAPDAPAPAVGESSLDRPWREVRDEALVRVEREYLGGLLRRTGGRVGETARRAGMQPRSLFNKMRRLGLNKDDFRHRPPETPEANAPEQSPAAPPLATPRRSEAPAEPRQAPTPDGT